MLNEKWPWSDVVKCCTKTLQPARISNFSKEGLDKTIKEMAYLAKEFFTHKGTWLLQMIKRFRVHQGYKISFQKLSLLSRTPHSAI